MYFVVVDPARAVSQSALHEVLSLHFKLSYLQHRKRPKSRTLHQERLITFASNEGGVQQATRQQHYLKKVINFSRSRKRFDKQLHSSEGTPIEVSDETRALTG